MLAPDQDESASERSARSLFPAELGASPGTFVLRLDVIFNRVGGILRNDVHISLRLFPAERTLGRSARLEVVPQSHSDLFFRLVVELELARLAVEVVHTDAKHLAVDSAPEPTSLRC